MDFKIDSFCDEAINANTYLISNDDSCIVIDPANNIQTLSKFIADKKLLGIFLTHGHYDHFKSLAELFKTYNAKIYLSEEAFKKINNNVLSCASMFGIDNLPNIKKDDCIFLKKGKITLGKFEIEIFSLPGHTSCSLAYLIKNHMFIGDTLFVESVGRWDLPTGSYNALMDSLNIIKKLPTNIICYPGHDSIFTIAEALMYNRYLK